MDEINKSEESSKGGENKAAHSCSSCTSDAYKNWFENCKCELLGDYKKLATVVLAFIGVIFQLLVGSGTLGMALVGAVVGWSFSKPILDCLRSLKSECGHCNATHGLVFIAFALTLLIQMPALLIAAVIVAMIVNFFDGK